jgi:AraC-like DNA-binding protein
MDPRFIVTSLQTELITGARTVCAEAWAQGGKDVFSDPFSRIYWIERGRGEIVHARGRLALCPGKLFAIPAHTPARYRAHGTMVLCWIHFRARLFGCLEIFSLMDWAYGVDLDRHSSPDTFWKTLLGLCNSTTLADSLRADGMLRELLARFARSGGPSGEDQFREFTRLLPAIRHIEQNLHRRIRLAELSKVVSLQPAYFCHLFSATIGQSPIDFINRKRVEKAQFLLLREKMPLKEVAAEVGFRDVYYFSRTFKKIAGISPAYYRRQEKHRE